MIIDGVLGSECVDSSGEILDIEGADILDLEEGRGVLNWEHQGADNKEHQGQEIVGKIVFAKKVFKASDCDSEREKHFWSKVKHPFIYGICRLYDGAGHDGAKAIAAQIRDHHANGEPVLVRFSVEGATLEKDGNTLKRSVIRRVALTLKPCNRTANSGLLEDPHAPAGFEKKPAEGAKDLLEQLSEDSKKFEHPSYMKLGGATDVEYLPFEKDDHAGLIKALVKLKVLKKMTTAGGGDVAPGQLEGGAALQREDVRRKVTKTAALEVLKSYLQGDKFDKTELKALLKQKIPDASDDFLEHFADIADDYRVKLRKADDHKLGPAVTNLANPFPELRPEAHPEKTDVQPAKTPGARPPKLKGGLEMQAGGKLLLPKPGIKRTAGNTPARLGLQQHFPNDHIYRSILDPDWGLENGHLTPEQHALINKTVHEPWHRAMSNWLPLNHALSQGKLPKSIIAKSVIFAAMSPNTSVPMQERYYGHYMDMLHEGLVDPLRPISDDAIQNFTNRSVSGQMPKWNNDFYVGQALGVNEAGDNLNAEGDAEAKGDLPQIRGMRSAHLIFPRLEHLIAKHKDDTQSIAGELMNLKAQTERATGRTHPHTDGYGPKLTRYLLSMMGGGNTIVPDRHMVRSSFDLQLHEGDRPNRFEGDPVLNKLTTQVVTDAKNEDLIRAMDHNFFEHHPAVRHVLNTFPKHFQGRERQANFPAFWLHWLTIKHYDQMRDRAHVGFNTDTDHRVFWDSVRDEMIKHGLHPHPIHDRYLGHHEQEDDDSFDFGDNVKKSEGTGLDPWPRHPHHADHPVWLKAAGVLHALTQRWGENPALLAYFSHVAPHMVKADQEAPVPPVTHVSHPAYQPYLFKAEALIIDLKKTLSDATQGDTSLREVAPHIQHVYRLRAGADNVIRRHPAGRFLTAGGHLHILEDYHGDLASHLPEGPLDEGRQQAIHSLKNGHKYDVAGLDEILDGRRPELWEAPKAAKPARPASSFWYQRHDQDKPDHLEWQGKQAHLNGHPMTREQTTALLQHVKNGHATVRYRHDRGDEIQKMELALEKLFKNDPATAEKVHAALGRLDQLVALGLLDPQHAQALRKHAFTDPMTGGIMGNKFAYTDFLNRQENRGGIHVALDGNDFKSVNDKFGHETGDRAIKAMGQALREAMDETGDGKLFRTGGDEFMAHLPTHEHAARFARAVREKLEKIIPIDGQHKLSMGLGFGMSPGEADQALGEAKKQKYHPDGMSDPDNRKWLSKYAAGQAPTFAHSLVPGFEGPIPLDDSQLTVKPPPAAEATVPAPTPAPVIHTPPSAPALAAKPA